METIFSHEVDVNRLSFSDPKQLGNTQGARIITINYGGVGKYLNIETPEMTLPYGINCFQDNPNAEKKMSANLSFDDIRNNPKNRSLFETINMIESYIIAKAAENCQGWLRQKDVSPDIAKALYSSSIVFSKDKNTGEITDRFPPTLKTKIKFYKNKNGFDFNSKAYDENKNTIDTNDIVSQFPRRTIVRAIIQCRSIWVAGGKYGCTWNIEQIKVVSKPNTEQHENECPFRNI
tara:strand:+ start:745 stop:1446 length:702 start_codon:yes stop_codon:yes gene_type:complete